MTRSLLFALAVLLSPLAAAEEALTPLETLAAAHSRGSSLLARGRASSDPIERGRLLAEGRRQLVTTLTKGKALVDQAVPTDDRAAESVRDQARYLVGRAALALSRSGSEDAARRLAQAEEAFRTLVEGRDDLTGTASDWLRHYAYLGLAESLAAGDSRGEARELAQDLTAIDWWYQPDKVPASYRKQVPLDRRHLERVCLEAHVLLARLLLEDGECARAIKVCAEIERAPHGAHWRRGAGAIDLISVRAQAAAALGDVEGAVRDLLALLQPLEARARASSAGAAVRDFRVGCLALAELSKLGEAAIRSPAGCFYAAFGHSRRGESGRSLQSYKRVLHTARTPNDRARWVPRAVREVGAVLFRQERYLEAALAYQIVFSEFPKDAFAPQAALFAIAALRRAVKQLGSPPGGALEDFKLLLLKGAEAHLSAEVRLRGRLADLAQDEGAKRWAKAAAGYVEISAETKAALRAKVLTRAGRCHWRDHLATRRVPPLTSARARLRESITLANSQGWTNEEAAARQTLARIEHELGNGLAALELLAVFDERLADVGGVGRARRLQAKVFLARGARSGADEAERRFATAGGLSKAERARFAYEMTSGLRGWGEARVRAGGDLGLRRAARRRAAPYAKRYLAAQGDLGQVKITVLAYLARVSSEGGDSATALRVADVASEIHMFKELGSLKTASPSIRAALRRLAARAKRRR